MSDAAAALHSSSIGPTAWKEADSVGLTLGPVGVDEFADVRRSSDLQYDPFPRVLHCDTLPEEVRDRKYDAREL